MKQRTKKEYGGYLPLELNEGFEYFAGYERKLLRFNSVKAALDRLLRELTPKTLWIPFYYCPSTTEALNRTGVSVHYYHIGSDLLPEELPDRDGETVLLVNYFGVLDDSVKSLALSFHNASVLIDNAHAFFCPPLMKENIYNVYSARKFFGVPDGAYAVGEQISAEQQALHYADETAYYLLKSCEHGTNAAYAEKKQSDLAIAAEYAPMSMLAQKLLKNADYPSVRQRRSENFSDYQEAFVDKNGLKLASPFPAYCFPLLCLEGSVLKGALVREKIYVPTLWSSDLLRENGNSFEQDMCENGLFLPLDQRYDTQDISYLISVVEDMLC